MVTTITKENVEKEVTKSTMPVVLKVYASWCGPCVQMTPIFEELSKEMGDKYTFAQLNVDDSRDLSIQYGVTTIPTFLFIKDNTVQGREVGYISKDDLKEKVVQYLK